MNNKVIIAVTAFCLILILVLGAIFYIKFIGNKKDKSGFLSDIPVLSNLNKKSLQKDKLKSQEDLIKQEQDKIEQEWSEINKQKDILQLKEKELIERELKLQEAENEALDTAEKIDAKLDNIKNIAKYYELMDATSAAKILSSLDDELVINIFWEMKRESVSQILSNMAPEKAANITKKMESTYNQ